MNTVSELIALREEFKSKLQTISTLDDRIHDLMEQVDQAYAALQQAADLLTQQRIAAGNALSEAILPTLHELGMPDARFDVQVDPSSNYTPQGHDTVCVLAVDGDGRMCAGTSTSGLFMKAPGRVGDSPLIGSGFYCDARYGAAAATGLGEDIMRGCLSYEAVSLMRRGAAPMDACRETLRGLTARKEALGEDKGSISLIALSPDGRYGAATTLDLFPFSVGTPDAVTLYVTDDSPIPACRPATAEILPLLMD